MHDVIVIGGGPGGTTAASLLARDGFSVLLLEREKFPRFQIGESLLPYGNDLFDRLGVTDQLSTGDFFPKYGAEFVTGTGEIAYTFRFDRNLSAPYDHSFQVKRSELDHLLLRNAAKIGVEVREEVTVTGAVLDDPDHVIVSALRRDGGEERIEGRFVIDASGHGCALGGRMAGKTPLASLKKIAVFAHYRNVPRKEGRDAGNTVVVVLRNAWFWMIPITKELMSVGLVVDRDHVLRCGLEPEELLARTIAGTPHIAARMKSAERETPVYTRKDFSYRMQRLTDRNFALVGDAAGFLDPIFSTGVFMAMKSADLVAAAVSARLRTGSMTLLKRYESGMQQALEKYLRFIDSFYRREFLEVFMQPHPRFGLIRAIVGVLAGNIFAERTNRLKLGLFFALVRLQKASGLIAPRIAWDRLPAAASGP